MHSGNTGYKVLTTLAKAMLLSGLLLSGAQAEDLNGPLAQVKSGLIRGVNELGVRAFKGIPYAAPPIKENRWRRPQPVQPWSGVRVTSQFGPACAQSAQEDPNTKLPAPSVSEDCLTLNVWTPSSPVGAPDAPKPVMVWLHGGDFRSGVVSYPLSNGAQLANQGVVVVTINYRLGYFGFFDHPALVREDVTTPANFGLLDQIEALKWVQENISAFGGDPGNVTLAGDDAGAVSAYYLMASPKALGLFHKVIAQSGDPWLKLEDRNQAKKSGMKAATQAGVAADADAAQLRAIPAGTLIKLNSELPPDAAFGPIIGDEAAPYALLDAVDRKLMAPVPLLTGVNSYEVSIAPQLSLTQETILAPLGDQKDAARALYPEDWSDTQFAEKVFSDMRYNAPNRWLALEQSHRASAWFYYFNYAPQYLREQFAGTPHGWHLPFTFGTYSLIPEMYANFRPQDITMARRFQRYLVNFMRSASPSDPTLPNWPAYNAQNQIMMVLGDATEPMAGLFRQRIEFFTTLYRNSNKKY
ncbi:Carboxylesterase type B [Hahella chejuensis KCTC 2396]|uniref:Carboxylesterase type B n=1 Tax=Hahella chejuensis (strain KCTC 2396) TaxID=349521 RepID=Q2SCW7_HAHCH|nr:carboxylesterase family protein [Hahella chejuensis]ABC31507.1 Carboxylesterase type B [Hahella chejuensis KCTC 2396]